MSQQRDKDEGLTLTWVFLLFVAVFSFIIWHTLQTELKSGIRWVRVAELRLAMTIHGEDHVIVHPRYGPQRLDVWYNFLRHVNPDDLRGREIEAATFITQEAVKLYFIILMCLFGAWAIIKGPGTKYKRRMSLESVMNEHAKNFPVIAPFVKLDPRKLKSRPPGSPVPENLPLFAEALSPEEWIAYHNIPYINKKLDREKAFQALVLQLGERWRGPEHLPLHMRALYAAFALKAIRKRKESDELLNELSLAWSHDKGLKIPVKLKSRINKIIKDPKVHAAVTKYANRHAFQATAMLRALNRARDEGGVLASAQFVWLRGYDRTLWYPLNNLGRKAYHAEAMGALTHYTYEIIAGQRIPTPKFDDAIRGLEEYVGGPAGRPIPKREKG
ncbi:MAG: hypothetical protein EA357_09990 [Micavibrio sp.]|nr:MAG: hypothetical protein EA357_09990 [Micavibrio sp.]